MESLFILIPVAIVFVIIAVMVFRWAVNNGQFEDLEAEGKRILYDDQNHAVSEESVNEESVDKNTKR